MKNIQQDQQSKNLSVKKANRHSSELSTLETDVYVWCYALLVVLATKE